MVAYDMYLEVCEGKMDATWTNADHVCYHPFREQLSTQMLQYDPRKRHYPGNRLMRISTKQHFNVRPGQNMKEKIAPNADGSVSIGKYIAAKIGGKRARVCVDIHQFTNHYRSVIRVA